MEIYHGYNTSFPSLLSALFMHCFESLCDDGNELMSVVYIGYLYKECFFKYSNKVKCDVAIQEVLLTAEYPLPEKNIVCFIFYCKCHLNVRHSAILLAALVLSYRERHTLTRSDKIITSHGVTDALVTFYMMQNSFLKC